MPYASCQEAFDSAPARFKKEAAKGLDVVYQFDLTGDGGGKWSIAVKNEQCEVKSGQAISPNVTFSMAASDYVDMINGKLNGQMAFMTGKLRLTGDMGLALRLQSLFA